MVYFWNKFFVQWLYCFLCIVNKGGVKLLRHACIFSKKLPFVYFVKIYLSNIWYFFPDILQAFCMTQSSSLIPYSADFPNTKLKPCKIYNCEFCSYSSVYLTNFKAHVNTHTGHKPFKCLICDKGFAQRTTLVRHTITHQKHILVQSNIQ